MSNYLGYLGLVKILFLVKNLLTLSKGQNFKNLVSFFKLRK